MADSYVDYTIGSGGVALGQIAYTSVGLNYISQTHITVLVTRASDNSQVAIPNADLTITTSPTLSVTLPASYGTGQANALVANDIVRIKRTTPISSATRTFQDASVLKASDLNAQNNQLLFALQEDADSGAGSLPIDTDGKYDAGFKTIKNVFAGTNANDAVNYNQMQSAALGWDFSSPQSWAFVGSNGTASGSNLTFTLSSPTPSATLDELFLIEVGGVIQAPSAYTITESSETYTLTLIGQNATVGGTSTEVIVRNFGYARNISVAPFISTGSTTPALILKQGSNASANTLELQNDSGSNVVTFEKDGITKFGVSPSMNFRTEINQSLIGNQTYNNFIKLGDPETAGTGGAKLSNVDADLTNYTAEMYGQLHLSRETGLTGNQKAIRVTDGAIEKASIDYTGKLTGTQLVTTGLATASALTASSGNINASSGDVISQNNITATTGNIVATSGNVTAASGLVKGNTLESIGNATIGGNLTVAGNITGTVVPTAGEIIQMQTFDVEPGYNIAVVGSVGYKDFGTSNYSTNNGWGPQGMKAEITPKYGSSKIRLEFNFTFYSPNTTYAFQILKKTGPYASATDTVLTGPAYYNLLGISPSGQASTTGGLTGFTYEMNGGSDKRYTVVAVDDNITANSLHQYCLRYVMGPNTVDDGTGPTPGNHLLSWGVNGTDLPSGSLNNTKEFSMSNVTATEIAT